MLNYCLFVFVEMKRSKREMEKLVRNLFTVENIVFWRIRMICVFIVVKKVI